MATSHFESLPKELIAHIASFCRASAALNLSATCRTTRAACWDLLTFKGILLASQLDFWGSTSLDIDAIESRAGYDVTLWARYALADDRAKSLAESIPDDPSWPQTQYNHPLKLAQSYIHYLPELFTVKHPFMAQQVWDTAVHFHRFGNPSQTFILAMTILASDENMINVIQRLHNARSDWFSHQSDTGTYLWALCTIALWARTKIKQRLAAWPYNEAARIPFIPIPKAHQILMKPLNDTYGLPVPFSRRPIELLGRPTHSFSAWDSWYRMHSRAALQQLTEGTWCGYYIHFGVRSEINVPLDAPMMQIRFEIDPAVIDSTQAFENGEAFKFHAKDCVDSIDDFEIHGSVSLSDRDVKISASKEYQHRGWCWDWDCRLTPFGIVGFWGRRRPRNENAPAALSYGHGNWRTREVDTLDRSGIVWLWKTEWTETSHHS